jgi:CRP-like cAMP-binding protein
MLNWEDKNKINCATCLGRSEMFNFLSEQELELISNNKYEIRFKKGEIIKKQGTHLSHVVSINSGLVKLYIEGYRGTNLILRIIKPTNFIGGPGLYFDQKHHYSLMALVDTKACLIEANTFKKIIHSNQGFANAFMRDMSINSLTTYDRLISTTQKQIPGRIADALLYLSRDIFESNTILPCITKKELSELTGMTNDSVVRILREFKNEDILKIDNGIEILDQDKLIQISNVG